MNDEKQEAQKEVNVLMQSLHKMAVEQGYSYFLMLNTRERIYELRCGDTYVLMGMNVHLGIHLQEEMKANDDERKENNL